MLGVENVPPARRELPCGVVKGVKSPRKVVGKCTWVCHARFPSLPSFPWYEAPFCKRCLLLLI